EIDSPHGKIILGILIFQDIVFVPMILVTPFLSGLEQNIWGSILLLFAKGVGVILFVIIGTKWVIPKLLYHIVKTRSRELFMLSVFVICFAIAWFTNLLGLSFALGGFLAGLIISETEYNHQVISNILPFRDIFTSFFFISIGMLLDVGFLVKEPAMILLLTFSVLVIKSIISFFASQTMGFPLSVNVLVGLAVCQVGEFSFVLFETGLKYKLFSTDDDIYHYILSVTILTMTITPFITNLAPGVSKLLLRLPLPKKVVHGWLSPSKEEEKAESLKDHLIIIGFGVNGRNLARAAKVANIPYVIIDMNPETVKKEGLKGEPIFFGDASYDSILEHVNCSSAKVVVVAISDSVASKRMIETIRRLNPKAHIIVRTRFLHEMLPLYNLGADDVIPQEYETSVEIFARVMANYLIPKDEIERLITEVRADGYEMLRSLSKEPISLSNLKLHLSDVEITALRVGQESFIVGQSLAQMDLRKKYGVTVLAIKRDSTILSDPIRDTKLTTKDVLIVLGQPDKIAKLNLLLKNK
ncbi:MAG TPA: potassium transporter KefB, partial [Spirochaetes bacterium]|nr:potassium transporter KefB [Spirochaetota bacterium]